MDKRDYTRRDFLKKCAAIGVGSVLLSNQASDARRSRKHLNIVFILIDDLGWMDTGCYGSKFYETPNI